VLGVPTARGELSSGFADEICFQGGRSPLPQYELGRGEGKEKNTTCQGIFFGRISKKEELAVEVKNLGDLSDEGKILHVSGRTNVRPRERSTENKEKNCISPDLQKD